MSKYTLLVLMFLIACKVPEITDQKVLVVHVRGLSYDLLDDFLDRSDNFMTANKSQYLKSLEPITNAVTISNIASFETGTFPAGHGIVGHLYMGDRDSLHLVSGFSKRFEIPGFWEQADLAGKKVLNVGALTLHGKYDLHEDVDTWGQGQFKSKAQVLQLIPGDGELNKLRVISGNSNLTFYRESSGSDSLIIDHDVNTENGLVGQITEGDWLEIVSESNYERPIASRIKWTKTKGDTIILYQRASYASRGYPVSFLDSMDRIIGPSGGWPNIAGYTSGALSLETLLEEVDAEMEQLIKVFRCATAVKDYDLILVDYPMVDRYGHLMYKWIDGTQTSDTLVKRLSERIFQDLSELNMYASQNNFEIIIASGHGFSEVHTNVNINRWLDEIGVSSDVNDENWQIIGVPGKVSSHLYLNPALSEEDKLDLEKLIKFASTNKERYPFIDKLYDAEQLKGIGLNHENSGDLFVMLKPGFVFSNDLSAKGELFGKPGFQGDHGYSSAYPSSHGFIYTNQSCDDCHVTDIAGIVKRLLGL